MGLVLALSIFLSFMTVHFYGGCFDDAVQMIHVTTGETVVGWLHYHAWGLNLFLGWLVPYFGTHYDLYRIPLLSCGLLAYGILGYMARHSKLATLGLATLLWAPETFCAFRILRYDGIHLLVLAIQLLMLTEWPFLAFLAGIMATTGPLIALPLVLVVPATLGALTLSYRTFPRVQTLLWVLGATIGGCVTLAVYPWDKWAENIEYYYSLYGRCAAKLPGFLCLAHGDVLEVLKRLVIVSDFDLMWNHYAAAPFFLVFFGVAVWTQSRMLSRFALCFAVSHTMFSMSYYPNLLFPLFVLAAGDAADGLKRN